jgi:hypothetical protein
MDGYVENDPVVWRLVLERILAEGFQSVKTVEVMNARVNLDHWSKRTHGTRYESLKIYLFGGFASRGFDKRRSLEL